VEYFSADVSWLKDVLDGQFEKARQFEGQGQARVVLFRFNGVDGLPGNAQFFGQVRLRPGFGRAKFAQAIFQR